MMMKLTFILILTCFTCIQTNQIQLNSGGGGETSVMISLLYPSNKHSYHLCWLCQFLFLPSQDPSLRQLITILMGPYFRGSCAAANRWMRRADWTPCLGVPSFHDRGNRGVLINFARGWKWNKMRKQKIHCWLYLQIPEIDLLCSIVGIKCSL